MEKDKKVESRFNSNDNHKKISIHERWAQDSDTMTILCKDGKRRSFAERDELRAKGIDV